MCCCVGVLLCVLTALRVLPPLLQLSWVVTMVHVCRGVGALTLAHVCRGTVKNPFKGLGPEARVGLACSCHTMGL